MAKKKKKLEPPDFAVSDVGQGLACIRPKNQDLMWCLIDGYIDPEGKIQVDTLPRTIIATYTYAYKILTELLDDGFSVSLFAPLPGKKG